MGGPTRAARYGDIPMNIHMPASNADILLALMVEDKEAIDHLSDIASVPGVDLIAIGPNDLSASLGITDPKDPLLKKTIEGIAKTLRRTGRAKMTFPLMNVAYPLDAVALQRMGVAYCNCGPADVNRLLRSFQQHVREINVQLGV
jgi:4-hydroxy-2-oxoheptanedioate aldolase